MTANESSGPGLLVNLVNRFVTAPDGGFLLDSTASTFTTRCDLSRLLKLQFSQILPKIITQLRPLQCKFNRRFEKAELIARVVTFALEAVAINFFLLQQETNAVSQLQLSS